MRYRPGVRTFLWAKKAGAMHHTNFEVTASTEDNQWHLITKEGVTLCGKEPRRDFYINITPGQEVMERLTGEDHTECQECKELARHENRGDK